jgi:hypothetical protein
MIEKRPKRSRDQNQLAKSMIDIATGQIDEKTDAKSDAPKNAFAVALGRRGGLKGGKARAKSLSKERRTEISRRAALKRWAAKADKD